MDSVPEWVKVPLNLEYKHVLERTNPGSVFVNAGKIFRMVKAEFEKRYGQLSVTKRGISELKLFAEHEFITDDLFNQSVFVLGFDTDSHDPDKAARYFYFVVEFVKAVYAYTPQRSRRRPRHCCGRSSMGLSMGLSGCLSALDA